MGYSGSFLPKFGQIWVFLEKRAESVFQYSNYLPLCQKSKQPNKTFKKKLLDGRTKNLFILLISLWNTVNFRVLQLVEKSQNLIDQEHFGPYIRNQKFPKYEICSSI